MTPSDIDSPSHKTEPTEPDLKAPWERKQHIYKYKGYGFDKRKSIFSMTV